MTTSPRKYFRDMPEWVITRVDRTTTPWYIYIWKGLAGSSVTDPNWYIKRVAVGSEIVITNSDEHEIYFDAVWADRASYQY